LLCKTLPRSATAAEVAGPPRAGGGGRRPFRRADWYGRISL